MTRAPRPSMFVQRGIWLAALAGVAAAGLVSAQPAPAPAPPTQVAPAPVQPPVAAAPEEAPPINVPTPEPIVVPPITETEVEAAPPPKAAVETPAEPVRRARYDVAIIQAIDKVTAESLRFEAPVGRPVRYKSLVFTVRACERSAPDELVQDSVVFLTVDSQPRPAPGKPAPPARQAFRGWMYASSPSLNPIEHPVYDAWLITCRAAAPPQTASR